MRAVGDSAASAAAGAAPPIDVASVFDPHDDRLHPLAVGIGIEIGPPKTAGQRR